jgi:hypothetical protein
VKGVHIVVHGPTGPCKDRATGVDQWSDVVVPCLVGPGMHKVDPDLWPMAFCRVYEAGGGRSIGGNQINGLHI